MIIYKLALANILAATEVCFEKSTEYFLAEFSATFEVKLAAALSLNRGIDLIAIAITIFLMLQKYVITLSKATIIPFIILQVLYLTI